MPDISNSKITTFRMPISFLSDITVIEPHICKDLNLCTISGNTMDVSDNQTVYDYALQPKCQFEKDVIPLWSKYFTTNKSFLKDTQNLLQGNIPNIQDNFKDVEDIWHEINTETGFHEKYHYIDLPLFKWVNQNSTILQVLSMYNILSPLITLSLPILCLLFPFIIIRVRGVHLSFDKYKEVLLHILSKHHIGKVLSMTNVSWDKRIYIMVTFGLYLLQTYQNIMSCIQFYKHSKIIHKQLLSIKDYLSNTLDIMNSFEKCCCTLDSYTPFIENMKTHRKILLEYYNYINKISPHSLSFKKITTLGRPMKAFYKLYNDVELYDSMQYSFGLSGYIGNLNGLKNNIENNKLAFCKFSKNNVSFTKAYYPPEHKETVHNTYNLKSHILLTGPNASGKTTLLKATISNLIISQQCGAGFYKKACIMPYHKLYCYINIPDTSGRDSLFQAEARRCKDILDAIENSPKHEKHFCVFDELYSGTNPYEATAGAICFLKYLNKNRNVKFFITTHYLDLCKQLDKIPSIKNFHMETKISCVNNVDQFSYLYKLKRNISNIRGGIKVFLDLGYPEEIIHNAKEIINSLTI